MASLWDYFPKGRRLPALERNILKYRAYEMVVILFRIEELRSYVLRVIRANDKTRIPEGTKKPYEKAWAYLVEKCVITQDESVEIQRLVDYRNTIARDIHQLTYDLTQERFVADRGSTYPVKYDYKALRKLKKYRTKIEDGLRHMHALLSLDGLMFEAAERTFEQEIERLRKRIGKQVAQREVEMKRLSEEFAALEDGELERIGLSIYDPRNQAENGKLTGRGVRVCEELFERRVSPLAVAYLMQLSYQATSRRYKAWKAKAEP